LLLITRKHIASFRFCIARLGYDISTMHLRTFWEATYVRFNLRLDRDVIVVEMHACVMKWRMEWILVQRLGFDGGADDTLSSTCNHSTWLA
jgi:hypothetical protein